MAATAATGALSNKQLAGNSENYLTIFAAIVTQSAKRR
jgi:hypothetical protein